MSVVGGNEVPDTKGRKGYCAGCLRNAAAGRTYIHRVGIDTSSLMSFPIKPFIPCCSKETPNDFLAVAEAASVRTLYWTVTGAGQALAFWLARELTCLEGLLCVDSPSPHRTHPSCWGSRIR